MSNIASVEGALQALRYHKINKSFIPDENVFDFVIEALEEFRELKERATAKKPTDVRYFGEAGYYIGLCPTCKNGNNSEYEYCGDCGQKLQWFERSEGKE